MIRGHQNKRRIPIRILYVAAILVAFTINANASVVLGPVAMDVSAIDVISGDGAINQIGLSANYVSGVTDFNQFTSTTTASYGESALTSLTGVGGLGSFYFDLGDIFSVDSIAVWGQVGGSGGAAMKTYDLYSSDTFGASGARILIGTFSAGGSPAAFAHTFEDINTQYLEIDVLTNDGYAPATRVNEVIFGGSASVVPVPAAFWLFGSTLGLLGWMRRKRA